MTEFDDLLDEVDALIEAVRRLEQGCGSHERRTRFLLRRGAQPEV